jgi:hypothetical protein
MGLRYGALSGARGGAVTAATLVVADTVVQLWLYPSGWWPQNIVSVASLAVCAPAAALVGAGVGAVLGAATGSFVGPRPGSLLLSAVAVPLAAAISVWFATLSNELGNLSPTGQITSQQIFIESAVVGTTSGVVGATVGVRQFKRLSRRNGLRRGETHEQSRE